MNALGTMGSQLRNSKNKKLRWSIAVIYTVSIIALLAWYAFFVNPGFLKPREITITGTITATSLSLERLTFANITFTNTGCGTKNVASIAQVGENSGTYSISLDNRYSYNVSIAWLGDEATINKVDVGTLTLDTFDKTIVRDWIVQP